MGKKEDIAKAKRNIQHLIDTKFQSDYKACFDHYDKLSLHNEKIDKAALVQMLGDAEIGNRWTRGTWAKEIIKQVDVNKDNEISWKELSSIVGVQPR